MARELNRELVTDLGTREGSIPPLATMEGVDLVTEGVITLERVCEWLEAKRPPVGEHAVAVLVRLLLESDRIDFVVGTRLNEAHQDPSLPTGMETRRTLLRRLASILEEGYLKQVSLRRV
ncbi:MAG: hypothetical protein ACYTGH_04250 [Planctomycetota bacterium]